MADNFYILNPHIHFIDLFSVDTEEFSFFDMKDDIYNDLREHAVPRVLKDVKLLEKEIEQGNLYLNQSKDLREVVQQVRLDSSVDLLKTFLS